MNDSLFNREYSLLFFASLEKKEQYFYIEHVLFIGVAKMIIDP
ncbi:hypothetical protein [Acinetobacter shaoyimingii]|nr:hypothetical protein [Acinetobacter shaoyimingii]